MKARMWIAALLTAALMGCLPGPESLTANDNVELVVTGTRAGDELTLTLADRVVVREVGDDDGAAVRFTFVLEASPHEGALRVARDDGDRCASFRIDVEPGARALASVDVNAASPCPQQGEGEGEPSAPRDFVRLREVVSAQTPCAEPPCTRITTIFSERAVVVDNGDGGGPPKSIRAEDLAALAATALSAEADLLFRGDDVSCRGDAPQGNAESVQLERQVRALVETGSTLETERVDVTGCETGTAAELRARVAFLRSLVDADD